MQKVIRINLNGHAYQLEEGGYEALAAYLARAEQQLAANPDRAEIMADLEQAIADKCRAYLGPHKTVVTAREIDAIVAEMGPVDAGAGEAGSDAGAAASDDDRKGAGAQEPSAKRLYRIPDGAMIGGVCTGLAAFFQIDVTIMRVAFVLMALITKGAGVIAYVVMMFVIPEASTARERAAAGGASFNAREIVDRVKGRATEGSRRWRREWRRQRRRWRAAAGGYGPPPAVAAIAPVFGLAHLALFVVAAAAIISLVNTGEVLGWRPPPDVPLWATVLILFVVYQIAVSPIRAVSLWGSHAADAGLGWFAFWHAVIWLLGLAFVIWIASNHLPEIREFVQRVPDLFREFVHAIRRLLSR